MKRMKRWMMVGAVVTALGWGPLKAEPSKMELTSANGLVGQLVTLTLRFTPQIPDENAGYLFCGSSWENTTLPTTVLTPNKVTITNVAPPALLSYVDFYP